jgi:glycosyltransferase involved in cell wall biosynthesis
MKQALMVATVSQSLQFQSPAMLEVLQDRGYDLTFAAREDAWSDGLEAVGSFAPIEGSRRPSPQSVLRMREQLKGLLRQPWDLVQTQSPIASACVRTTRLHAPSIYVAHGFHFHRNGSPAHNAAFRAVEFALAGRTQAIAVVSGEDFAAARRMGLHRRALLWHLPGAGVDLTQFAESADPHRRRSVLFCGELNANKDPLTVIDAVAEMRHSGDGVTLTIVGDGPLAALVGAAARQHSWLEWFPSLPPEAVARLMAESGVVAAPSHREGLPRVIIEALACGTPVVARSNRGSRELLTRLAQDGRSALLQNSDPLVWSKALSNQLEAGPVGDSGRQAVDMYGLDNFSGSYARLLDAVESGAVDVTDQPSWSNSNDGH